MRFLGQALFLLFFFTSAQALTPEEVFWWWDDGLIQYEQVEEFLELIEKEDNRTICELKEAYWGELCEMEEKESIKPNRTGGKVHWKASLDSTGGLYSQRLGLEFGFRNYNLRAAWKGNQELSFQNPDAFTLIYKEKNAELFWGTLRYQNLKLMLPTEDLFGVFGYFNWGFIQTGVWGGIDTSFGGILGFGKKAKPHFHLIGHFHENKASFSVQTQQKWGRTAVWWSHRMATPLFFLLFNYREAKYRFGWRGQFYYHRNDSLESPLRLSQTIEKNQLWSSQRQSIQVGRTQISLIERAYIPLDTGKVKMEAGIDMRGKYRNTASLVEFLCRDFSNACRKPRIRLEAGSVFWQRDSLYGKIRLQGNYFRELNHIPRLVLGIKHRLHRNLYLKEEWISSENRTSETPWVFRQEARANISDHGFISLRYDIRMTWIRKIHPHRLGFSLEALW